MLPIVVPHVEMPAHDLGSQRAVDNAAVLTEASFKAGVAPDGQATAASVVRRGYRPRRRRCSPGNDRPERGNR